MMGHDSDLGERKCGPKGTHKKPDFFGTATVGEKGQIVIPQEARQAYEIKPGDKLLVAGKAGHKALMLIKADVLTSRIEHLNSELDFLKAMQSEEE